MSADQKNSDSPASLLAEFDSVDALLAAAEAIRAKGYTRFEAFSPFAVKGLDKAMGARPTRLPWIVLMLGLSGMVGGLAMMWWTNATDLAVPSFLRGYPFITSGKPVFSLPANIPVVFEITVLLSAFGAFFGMLAMNGLPRLHNPLFEIERFRRVTADRFFVVIDSADAAFEPGPTADLLQSLGALSVEQVWERA